MAQPETRFEWRGRRGGSVQTPLDVVLRCFAAAVSADSAVLIRHDGAGRPELAASWGSAAGISDARWVSGGFVGRLIWSDQPGVEFADGSRRDGTAAGAKAVAAPIMGPNGPIGAVYADFDTPSSRPARELEWTAASHAALAALCMQDGAHVAASLWSSCVDELTGCLTYERTVELLISEIERSKRRHHALSCGFVDFDGFKAINESLGHLGGNRVLAAAGEALRRAARTYDGIGRFGGDEFLIVLPETKSRAAVRAVERMRRKVSAAVQETTGTQVEMSVGVAEWQLGYTARDLLEASDRALRAAKAAGGGRVTDDGRP